MHFASEIAGKRFVPHSQAAKIRGVSGRTLDRWIADGIIPKPEIINGRKYHAIEKIEVIAQPQVDA